MYTLEKARSPADALLAGAEGRWPRGVAQLATAMLAVSLPTLIQPSLQEVLGGVGYLPYPWQVFSSAFEHGWPGFPLWLHLALNLVLLAKAGPPAERLLGTARFLALTLFAILLYWLARKLTGLDANGASVFIWAYGPILFLPIWLGRRGGGAGGEAEGELRFTLWILWVVVPAAMGVFLYLSGVEAWLALPVANAFHISATLAGALAALLWRNHARQRLEAAAFPASPLDRAAAAAGWTIPLLLSAITATALIGWI